MSSRIINRGRGPEIAGTRVTVYRVMDFLRDGSSEARIAKELELTPDDVRAAMEYIDQHRAEVEEEYAKILARVQQGNPAWVEAEAAGSLAELRRRIEARDVKAAGHAHPRGQ
jgi:uncharacterized protein (DUF433 family)